MFRPIILTFAVLCLVSVPTSPARAEREITIQFKTPTLGRDVAISHIWKVGDELWVVTKIAPQRGFGATAIGTAKASVKVDVGDKAAVHHFVIGKDWNWWEGDKVDFIESVDALKKQMKKDGKKIDSVLYPKAKKSDE